ncbi:MAG: biopolymer transporter ExbD [Parachlamydiaceae bacterium]|nr:biopolymer transporter ExbD [Parachlamydiaceae bacterium]
MSRSRISFTQYIAFEEPTINLTPLIDVVFVILIMFIVIAPLLELDRIQLAEGPSMPLATVQSAQETSQIAIHVHKDNTIWFNHQSVNPLELKKILEEAKKNFPQANPQIYHDKEAHFGVYQSVKNAVEMAGFSQMDVILQPS